MYEWILAYKFNAYANNYTKNRRIFLLHPNYYHSKNKLNKIHSKFKSFNRMENQFLRSYIILN